MTDTDLATLAEAAQSQLGTATDFFLLNGQECVISTTSRDIIDGDVFIVPTGNIAHKGVLMPACLVRFSHGSALLAIQNDTLEPILLPEEATVASFPHNESFDVRCICRIYSNVPTCQAKTSVSVSLDTTISAELTPGQRNLYEVSWINAKQLLTPILQSLARQQQ